MLCTFIGVYWATRMLDSADFRLLEILWQKVSTVWSAEAMPLQMIVALLQGYSPGRLGVNNLYQRISVHWMAHCLLLPPGSALCKTLASSHFRHLQIDAIVAWDNLLLTAMHDWFEKTKRVQSVSSRAPRNSTLHYHVTVQSVPWLSGQSQTISCVGKVIPYSGAIGGYDAFHSLQLSTLRQNSAASS